MAKTPTHLPYASPASLEQAIKAAAITSPLDTHRAMEGFYFHRLLCRVFSIPNTSFVLKGGQGMLARSIASRATRDIDLAASSGELSHAVDELKSAAAIDLGDYVTFEFREARPIQEEARYRSGQKVTFTPFLGQRRKQDVSVDLVASPVLLSEPDIVTPVDRLDVQGLVVCDYRVYPVACAIADKLCALFEQHNGHASSRVKDLVDVLVYAVSERVIGEKVVHSFRQEARLRHLEPPASFCIPEEWRRDYTGVFAKLVRQTKLSKRYEKLDAAVDLGRTLANPILDGTAIGMAWDYTTFRWIPMAA